VDDGNTGIGITKAGELKKLTMVVEKQLIKAS